MDYIFLAIAILFIIIPTIKNLAYSKSLVRECPTFLAKLINILYHLLLGGVCLFLIFYEIKLGTLGMVVKVNMYSPLWYTTGVIGVCDGMIIISRCVDFVKGK